MASSLEWVNEKAFLSAVIGFFGDKKGAVIRRDLLNWRNTGATYFVKICQIPSITMNGDSSVNAYFVNR